MPWAVLYLLASAAILFAAHPPLPGDCYGFVDDYVLLEPGRPFPDWPFLGWVSRDGRPLYGLLLNLLVAPLRDVCDLGFLRLLNIGLAAVVATQICALARRHGWPMPAAAALGLLVLALPGFAVAAAWATLVGPLAAMSLGLGAAWFAMPAAEEQETIARPAVGRLAAAACLLAAALALYQPGAMAFLTGVAIALVRRPLSMATARERLLPAALVFVAVVAAYAIFYLMLPMAIPGGPISPRATLILNPWRKLTWFAGVPLRQAVNLFNLQPVPRFGLCVLGLVAVGTFLRHRGFGRGIVAIIAQAGLVVLAFLPNLVVAESWPAFRSSLPMAMTVAVLLAAAVLAIAERLAGRRSAAFGTALIAIGAAYGFVATSEAADRGLVRLQQAEWRIIVAALRDERPSSAPDWRGRTIVLVQALAVPECARWQRFDEFGLPSTARPWAAQAMLRHGWRQVHGEAPPPRFVVTPNAPPPSAAVLTIDMPAALSARARAICGGQAGPTP